MTHRTPQFPAVPDSGRRHLPVLRRTRAHRATAAIVQVAALTGLALTGCAAPLARATAAECPAGQASRADTVVITATATSAEPRPALPESVVAELTNAGRTDTGCVLIVRPDDTAVARSLTPRRGTEIERGTRREQARQRTLDLVLDEIAHLTATTPGLDTRAALVRAVRAHPTPGRMVVISSGLSTAEPVDLNSTAAGAGWRAAGPFLGRDLRTNGWLDLTDWEVDFVGLGSTAGRQAKPSDAARTTLSRLWVGLCGAVGARCADLGAPTASGDPFSGNAVPIVTLPEAGVYADRTLLSSSSLFGLGSDVLSAQGLLQLQTVVQRAISDDLLLRIVGSADAATGTPERNLNLSAGRAHAVRRGLMQLGLGDDRVISVEAIGSDQFDPEQEKADPDLQRRHRGVEIVYYHRTTA